MSQEELQSAQQELFDILTPALVVGTMVIGWLAFALHSPAQGDGTQAGSALIGRWIATTGAVLLVAGLAWAVRRWGHFRAATYILVAGLTVLIAAALALWPGVPGDVLPYLYPLIVITAGFLIRPVAAIQMVGLIVLVVLSALLAGGEFTFLNTAQLLPPFLLTSITAVVVLLSGGHMMTAISRAAQSESQSEQQIEHATANLKASRDQLTTMSRILKETQSATIQLIANLSHDFRWRVNAIVNFSHILADGRRGPVTSEQQSYLRRMYDTGERMLRSLADLADLASIEAGEVELSYQPVNLSQLGEEAIQAVATLTEGKWLDLYNTIPSDLQQPLADEDRIRQVLLSLLENAIQHTGRGQVTLSARTQNSGLLVSVSDTGAGIRSEEIEYAFEPFACFRDVPMRSRLGSGLGLPISKRLVELHGGRIWVESQVSTGSTFHFSLPLQPPQRLPSDNEQQGMGESLEFESELLPLSSDGEGPKALPQTAPQLMSGSRVIPTVRQRFMAVGLVGLFSILSLVIGGIALQMHGANEGVLTQRGSASATIVGQVGATPTTRPLGLNSPTPAFNSTPTSSPAPTSTATSTVPPTTSSSTAKPPTPTRLPSHTPSPTPTSIPPTHTPSPPTATATVVPSPAALPPRIVFATDRDGQFDLYAMFLDGTNLTRLTTHPADDRSPVVSPDGKRILFYSERDGVRDLYGVDIDGSGLLRLTGDLPHGEAPAWSPNGERIAFAAYRQGNYDVYIANADGSDQVRLTTSLAWDQSPAWSPDGRRIAFVSDQRGYNEIYVMPTVPQVQAGSEGSGPTRLTTSATDHWSPAWSPDGNRLVFSATDAASVPGTRPRRSIFVMNADGGSLTRLTDATADDLDPTWSPDGRILFASDRSGNFDLYLITPDGSDLTRVTDTPFDELEPAWASGF